MTIRFTRDYQGYSSGSEVSVFSTAQENLIIAAGAATRTLGAQQAIVLPTSNMGGGKPGDVARIVDGSLVDGDGNLYGVIDADSVESPSSNLSAAVGSAGALTGAYYYTQTFVTAQGETAPWPGTATVVNPSAQQVNLSSIPIGPAGTTARRIYRTPATPTDAKDYRFVAQISDNTTTTYTDNLADGSLGSPVRWSATNRGELAINGGTLATVGDQSTSFGAGTFATNAGYASVAIGFEALKVNTTGRRNVAVGTYALTSLTTAYECTGVGVHAGGGITTGIRNTMLGYAAGGATQTAGDQNTAVGASAFVGNGASKGQQNTAVGYQALTQINTADNCIALGHMAGKYANASRQIFIDSFERSNIAGCQDNGWLYGEANSTVTSQLTRMNSLVRIGCGASPVVSGLPAASSTYRGYRGYVTDASVAYTSANLGSTVVGGGANIVPVFCNGTNWVIG